MHINESLYPCTLPPPVFCADIHIAVYQSQSASSFRISSLENQKIPGWITLTKGGRGPVLGFRFRGRKFIWPSSAPVLPVVPVVVPVMLPLVVTTESSWLAADDVGQSGEGRGLLLTLKPGIEPAHHSPQPRGSMRVPWRGDIPLDKARGMGHFHSFWQFGPTPA